MRTATLRLTLAALAVGTLATIGAAQAQERKPLLERLFSRDREEIPTQAPASAPATSTTTESAPAPAAASAESAPSGSEDDQVREALDQAREAARRFQESGGNSSSSGGSAASESTEASPAPPAESSSGGEPVARERQASDTATPAPVATPVATAPPAAVAEPVARPAPEGGADGSADSGDVSLAMLAEADVPTPADLEPRFEKGAPPVDQGPVMEITSDESVLHNEAEERMVEFIGDVFLDHPGFNLSSDRLEVYLNDEETEAAPEVEGEEKPPFKRAVATGSMIKIVRINPDGETEIAHARRADFDGVTGDVVLSGGPPQLQSGQVYVNPTGVEDKIHLLASGTYRVETTTVPSTGEQPRSVITIPVKGDNATKSPSLLPTQLDDVRGERDN